EVAEAGLPVDGSAEADESLDVAIDRAHRDGELLGQHGGGHRPAVAAERIHKGEEAFGAVHGPFTRVMDTGSLRVFSLSRVGAAGMARDSTYDHSARKRTVSLTLNGDLYAKAKELGINASRVAEEALAAELTRVLAE